MEKELVVGPLAMRMLGLLVGGMVWQRTLRVAKKSWGNLVFLHDGCVLGVNEKSLKTSRSLSYLRVVDVRGGADVTYGRGAPWECRWDGGTGLDWLGRGILAGARNAWAWREMKRGKGTEGLGKEGAKSGMRDRGGDRPPARPPNRPGKPRRGSLRDRNPPESGRSCEGETAADTHRVLALASGSDGRHKRGSCGLRGRVGRVWKLGIRCASLPEASWAHY